MKNKKQIKKKFDCKKSPDGKHHEMDMGHNPSPDVDCAYCGKRIKYKKPTKVGDGEYYHTTLNEFCK